MSIQTDGIQAEKMAYNFLKGKVDYIQQLDWLCQKNDKWFFIEVKNRELFKAPPFDGTGLDKKQLWLRMKVLKELKLQTYLLVFIKNTTDIYGQYLSVLEKGEYFDTKNQIRIYNLKNFTKLK